MDASVRQDAWGLPVMKEALPYPHQVDYAWLAVDDQHHVAIFFTGGEGPMHATAHPANESACQIEEQALALPEKSDVRLHVSYPRLEDYIAMAKRGVYAFDWGDVHRTRSAEKGVYELVAEPLMAITLEQLPTELRLIVEATHLVGIKFSQSAQSGIKVCRTAP